MVPKHSLIRRTPIFKKNPLNDNDKFQPLPLPAGAYPYRLPIARVSPLTSDRKMVFHIVGDTGGVRNPAFQRMVAGEMSKQCWEAPVKEDRPQFLYHLGDVVYNHGEAENYYAQFFDPFADYPGPIFAIPGNHDGDVNPIAAKKYKSLDAFTRVFCDTRFREIPFAGGSGRSGMVQPNVYWTLETPLATVIGLYSNVPKYGLIAIKQKEWFIEELKAAGLEKSKAIIVCVHHAPFSADINHGSSLPMISLLHEAFERSGVKPDIVFSGHVHNYQRFHQRFPDGKTVPFIVAGAGGYDELHSLVHPDDMDYTHKHPLFENVHLENYCDTCHGFLKVTLEHTAEGLTLQGHYFTLSGSEPAVADTFTLRIER